MSDPQTTPVAGKPCIICVAITGSLPTKENNPAVPITIAEQVDSTHEAFEAGASIVHAHVRDDEGKPTSDPDRFARLMEGIRALRVNSCYWIGSVAVKLRITACTRGRRMNIPSARMPRARIIRASALPR